MVTIRFFQVDAFTDAVFQGNPAAVCPLDHWLSDSLMQSIAMENNLSETAFFVPETDGFALRWFTPVSEVDLCGHATLAAAHVLVHHLDLKDPEIRFHTASGLLTVTREEGRLAMDFPSRPGEKIKAPMALVDGLVMDPVTTRKARDYMAVLETQTQVLDCKPDLPKLAELDCTGIIITAPGEDVDFVSRFFAPREGIPEDPVTGSAHCTLIPYWAKRLGKETMIARQVSRRGGTVFCRLNGKRVTVSGHAVTFAEGTFQI